MTVGSYSTLVFDCDGVVLDSNRVKTDAFRQAALPYGAKAAEALVQWHVTNGGISRYKKFEYFLEHIVPQGAQGPGLDALLAAYAAAVREGLATCAVAEGLHELRAQTPDVPWLIVSGGDQAELREVFAARGLDVLFDGGIFGSPDSKEVILARELERGTITQPALFLGDSTYDHRASTGAGLDFIFVFGWTEYTDWQTYTKDHPLRPVQRIIDVPR
ncbi:haloacid dehalogenase-like hydrolase [Roseovarius gaetbuli]|uniref:phosphoglycolate phosphatase n=1 Tax=Roseovarius gaetbuli TaxID=1356575 RepID=A0A1X7A7K6_9RHOB|nr:HAD family hydrolase [Roseovarius gaetbuli]SLN72516.1 haloacid dehalogenase-like hydrolase [Roseovarius gaetbuli]